ncbi:MAG: proprotein convertase P-domain-containing protein [Bacteroidetes bacterium]|nr:proprotein convertase P-domain-containing protein [Bacteroidota bacterium]
MKAPNGSQIELSTDNGGTGNNYTNTVFVTGSPAITGGSAPFTGNYAPEQSFNSLTGSANGSWNLVVKDDAGSDVGTLLDWTISMISSTGVIYSWSSVPSGF